MTMTRSPTFLTCLFLASLVLNRFISATCFFPNGNAASSHTPCNAAAEFSHCCPAEDLCLGNGYCFTSGISSWGNRVMRGSCTDPQWKSSACPQYCADLFNGQDVTIGLARDYATGFFCCQASWDPSAGNCTVSTNGSKSPFPLANAGVIFNRTSGSTGPNDTTIATATVTGSSASSTASGGRNCHKAGSTSKEVGIGVGVGVSLGLFLLAALVLLWRSNTKRKNLERQLNELKHNDAVGPEMGGPPRFHEQKPAPLYQQNSELDTERRAELEGR